MSKQRQEPGTQKLVVTIDIVALTQKGLKQTGSLSIYFTLNEWRESRYILWGCDCVIESKLLNVNVTVSMVAGCCSLRRPCLQAALCCVMWKASAGSGVDTTLWLCLLKYCIQNSVGIIQFQLHRLKRVWLRIKQQLMVQINANLVISASFHVKPFCTEIASI